MTSPIWPPDGDKPPADEKQKQIAGVFRERGKAIVEAPPGTGKTFLGVYLALCASRLGWVSKRRPALFLTFSRNARVQIEQEIARFRNEGWISTEEEKAVKVSNYHAFYFEALRRKAALWGCACAVRPSTIAERYQRLESLLNDSARTQAVQLSFDGFGMPGDERTLPNEGRISPDDMRKAVHQASLVFALERFQVSDLLGSNESLLLDAQILQRVYSDASAALKNGRPHYDDFAPLFLNILEHCSELLEWLRLIYPVVILDEFQDTDSVQWEILRKIHPGHIVILYDRYQMIYEWRGARPGRIEQAKREFEFDQNAQKELIQVHRAGNQAQLVRFILELRTDELWGHNVTMSGNQAWLTLQPAREWRNQPHVSEESRCLTAIRCSGLIDPSETTAILTRANYLANLLYNQLRLKRERGAYFVCRWIGSEDNPDETMRDHIWCLRQVSADLGLRAWLGQLLDHVIPESFLKELRLSFSEELACEGDKLLSKRRKDTLKTIRQRLSGWWDSVKVGDYQALARALGEIPQLGRIVLGRNGFLNPDIVYYLREFAKSVESYHTRGKSGDWAAFCDYLEDNLIRSTYLRLRQPSRGLYVLTVHQSKGREFDHVIIPWLSAKGEPWEDRQGGHHPLKYNYERFEDRRLLYVAFTRARQHVTILYPEEDPSPFIQQWKLV